MIIRVIEDSDMPLAHDLHITAFTDIIGRPPTHIELKENFSLPNPHDFEIGAFTSDQELIGMGAVHFKRHHSYLDNVYVRPDFRGRKTGNQIVEAAIDIIQRTTNVSCCQLMVKEASEHSVQMYEGAGFRISYRWDDGILLMERNVPQQRPDQDLTL